MTGQSLRSRRLQAGLSMSAVAGELGVHVSTVSRFEQRADIQSAAAARYLTAVAEAFRRDQARRRAAAQGLIESGLEALAAVG